VTSARGTNDAARVGTMSATKMNVTTKTSAMNMSHDEHEYGLMKGVRVEFSRSTRMGEKFSAPQDVLVFEKMARKGKWQSSN
jgi:hypothetical protein